MIVIKLYGGLGNQMFQYALGRNLQINHDKQVMFDTSWFHRPQDPLRPYRLNKFRTIVPISSMLPQQTIHEDRDRHYKFDPSILEIDNVNLFGYWQHHKYVDDVIPILREEFLVSKSEYTGRFQELRARIMANESTAIHVRRGDYVTIKGHRVLPTEYYDEALTMVDGHLYVFSDDIEWCKHYFGSATYIEEEDYLAFELLRLCKHKIIANSTFSWWAAKLSNDPTAIIITPRIWRDNPEEQMRVESGELCPDEWIRL